MNRGAKTTTVAKVTMRGEWRVVYNSDTLKFRLIQRYYGTSAGKQHTRTVGEFPTLGRALAYIADIALNIGA